MDRRPDETTPTPLQQSSNLLATILVGGGLVAAALGVMMTVFHAVDGRWDVSGGARGSALIAIGALVFLVLPGWFLKQSSIRAATAAEAHARKVMSSGRFAARRRLVHSPVVERLAGGLLSLGFLAGGVGLLLVPELPLHVGLIATAIALGLSFLLLRAIENGLANTVVALTAAENDDGETVLVIDFWAGGKVHLKRSDVARVERGVWTASRGPAAAAFVRIHLAPGVGRGYRPLIVLREPWDLPFDAVGEIVERWHHEGRVA